MQTCGKWALMRPGVSLSRARRLGCHTIRFALCGKMTHKEESANSMRGSGKESCCLCTGSHQGLVSWMWRTWPLWPMLLLTATRTTWWSLAYDPENGVAAHMCSVHVRSKKVLRPHEMELTPEAERLAARREIERLSSLKFLKALSAQLSKLIRPLLGWL